METLSLGEGSNIPRRCHACEFWTGDRRQNEGQGECHRYPITAIAVVQQNSVGGVRNVVVSGFPGIPGMAWCGEWKPYISVLQ